MDWLWIISCNVFVWWSCLEFGYSRGLKAGEQSQIEVVLKFVTQKDKSTMLLDATKQKHDSDLFTTNREN